MSLKYLFVMVLGTFLSISCSDDHVQLVSTATSNVTILTEPMIMPRLDRERTIRVYLPPNYHTSTDNYPVLNMHDGQNLFDDQTSYAGEWGVDESLERLSKENGLELIVIGIDNGQELRMKELSPWTNTDYGEAEGEQYMNFIVSVLKPYIDSHYRTLKDRENTGLMGSSMGGLISHYGIFKYPEIFSKAGIFSPSYWFSDDVYTFSNPQLLNPMSRLYFLMGGEEGKQSIENLNKMMIQLLDADLENKAKLKSKIVEGGEHNEQFWRSEFSEAILWLYLK